MSMRPLLLALVALVALAVTASAAFAASLSNVTIMTYSPGHGTQVEYFDKAGNTFLWYPGNRGVVRGKWKLEGTDLCFSYRGNSYNPVTGHRGSGWECMPLALQQKSIVDRAKGDAFGLSTGTLPFQLQPARTTIAKLKKNQAAADAAMAPFRRPPQEQCAAVVANANKSRAAMVEAALLYYHGKRMGERCANITVDYVMALTLIRKAGDKRIFASLLKDLRQKAASGNPKAVGALQKIDTSPFGP
jgi:hypothetical protein